MILLALSVSGCAGKTTDLPPSENYEGFLKQVTPLLCEKMLVCYEKLTRTVSPEAFRELTPENCARVALQNLETKIAAHSESMKKLSIICYEAELSAPCHQFATIAYWHPACSALRVESEKAFREPKGR
jgi:hypothetical protein